MAYSRGNAYLTTTAQIRGDPQSRTDEFIVSAPGFLKNRSSHTSAPQSGQRTPIQSRQTALRAYNGKFPTVAEGIAPQADKRCSLPRRILFLESHVS
jgi:hypothetical protein